MIVTLTPNPAVDISTSVDRLMPTQKLHCAQPRYDAGGGGINVSKAIHRLGGHSLAIFTAGGATGNNLRQLVQHEGLTYRVVDIAGLTRESFVVTETATSLQYRFGTPGPVCGPTEATACLSALAGLTQSVVYVVLSGSLPPGLPDDFYAHLTTRARALGARVVIDTAGIPLQKAVQAGVFLIKPNLSELARLVGKEVLEGEQIRRAARDLIGQGHCQVVVVSLGARGALAVTADSHEYVPSPVVKTVSTVGAGDSLVGGLVFALSQGKTVSEAVRLGVACGTAATMHVGTELFDSGDPEVLLPWINQQAGLTDVY